MGEKTRVCDNCDNVVVGEAAIENGRQVGNDFYCAKCKSKVRDGNR
ncbi:hypothetical protein [Sphingobium sp. Leaf26]|nr:hypothetical protein [Sphingobium sp. Leaf26]